MNAKTMAAWVAFARAWVALVGVLALWPSSSLAQQTNLQTGLHYYVVINLDNGQVLQRGKTGTAGIAFDALFLAANTHYRVEVLEAATLLVGQIDFTTPDNGALVSLPQIQLGTDLAPDADNDGLSDYAEFIVGTDPHNPSTRGDGILDGTAVREGLDPLNGQAAATGVLGAAGAMGTAIDICAINNLAILAESDKGVSIFNIFNTLSPVWIGQVQTAGTATAVGCYSNTVVVADGASGVAIIDITDPPAAKVVQEVNLGGYAQAVVVVPGTAYVGLQGGQLVQVDLATGIILARATVSSTVHDLAVSGSTLFVLLGTELDAFDISNQTLNFLGKVGTSTIGPQILTGRRRLFVGGGYALAACAPGYDSIDVRNPAAMKLVAPAQSIGPNSFKQIVANGSGLGVAAVGVAPRYDGTQNISLYDVSNPAVTTNYLTMFATPQIAYAVSIYNGIAYVATGTNGLAVVNYLSYDTKGVPPTITLSASFSLNPAQVEEGKSVWVAANVTDDVQVRNVEFYINDMKVATDGNFPFEYQFITPPRSAQTTSFTLRARAWDTGGNSTWSDQYVVTLTPDITPPQVRASQPPNNGISGSVDSIAIHFNKPINPATVNSNSITLLAAGPDGIFGTADDIKITNGTVTYQPNLNSLFLNLPTNLPTALYEVLVGGGISDFAGNPIGKPYKVRFWAFGQQDSDHDGVPDDVEIALGLNPFNPYSLNDGILDGDRDYDHDHLSNAAEIIMGTDPKNPHSVSATVLDGDLDRDNDGLTDSQEFLHGTNPFVADSDGDGWNDESEVTAGSDPLDPNSKPKLYTIAQPAVGVGLYGFPQPGAGAAFGLVVAQPPVAIGLTALGSLGGGTLGITLAYPPVAIGLNSFTATNGLASGTTVAYPPVALGLTGFGSGGSVSNGVTVGYPPVKIDINP